MSRWAFKYYPAIKWAPALIGSLHLLWITCNRITSFELHDETSDKAESAAEYTEVLYKNTLIMVKTKSNIDCDLRLLNLLNVSTDF